MYFMRKGVFFGEVVLREYVIVLFLVLFCSVRVYKRVLCWIDLDILIDDGRFRILGG